VAGSPVSISTDCHKRCDFRLIGCSVADVHVHVHPAPAAQSATAARSLDARSLPGRSYPSSTTVLLLSISIAPGLVTCTLCAGATTKRDGLGLLREIFRSRSRAVPFLAEQYLIG
jgi:hypothetical protein